MLEIIQKVNELSFSAINLIICIVAVSILSRDVKLNKFESTIFKVGYVFGLVGLISSIPLILNKLNIIHI